VLFIRSIVIASSTARRLKNGASPEVTRSLMERDFVGPYTLQCIVIIMVMILIMVKRFGVKTGAKPFMTLLTCTEYNNIHRRGQKQRFRSSRGQFSIFAAFETGPAHEACSLDRHEMYRSNRWLWSSTVILFGLISSTISMAQPTHNQ
jgi:hypothetical protein